MTVRILTGDCRDILKTLPDESVHCCVTSPPYWGLRDYGVDGQIGLDPSPEDYVAALVATFDEVHRVLRSDGTLWLNLDDSYATDAKGERGIDKSTLSGGGGHQQKAHPPGMQRDWRGSLWKLKRKDLVGIPWRVALALQAQGWWLRCDSIWAKDSCMPERVFDRPTRSHEYMFLLSKSERYYYDADAVREDTADSTKARLAQDIEAQAGSDRAPGKLNGAMKAVGDPDTRNMRSVWRVNPAGFREAHFATFPPALIEPCIKAGCPQGGVVLDPFGGAGTTGLVADNLRRNAILIELNPEYAVMAERRISSAAGMFAGTQHEQQPSNSAETPLPDTVGQVSLSINPSCTAALNRERKSDLFSVRAAE